MTLASRLTQRCTHYCKGCFNQEAWDFDYGQPFDAAAEEEILNALKPAYIKGFSLLGGEPFEPANQKALLPFMRQPKSLAAVYAAPARDVPR